MTWPVSAEFRAALLDSHRAVVVAQVTDPNGGELKTLDVTGGSVSVDETRAVRRTCSLTLADPGGDLIPAGPGDLLHPLSGNELRLYRGVALAAGVELAPLGVFRLTAPRLQDGAGGQQISIDGYDRADVIRRNDWTAPYQVANGAAGPAALQALIANRWPTAAAALLYNIAVSSYTTPALVFGVDQSSDPWADAASIALGMALEVLFDQAGALVARPVSDPTAQPPAFRFVEGDGCTMTDVERDLSTDNTYNGVILDVQNTALAAPLHSEVWDTNPSSPTYYLGPFGKRPSFITSSTITTQAQADAAASAQLLTVLGATEEVSISAVVDPTVDAGDVTRIVRGRLHVDANYAIRAATIPLGVGDKMTVTCRPRKAGS